ncbi:MAG: YciI family protein [Pseudomonadota bacterium]|nr:hypothetical protein [Gammaproteobacteria bacterium]MEE2683681.1 YciI family protein [Pseudomonadota bacterium]|tara:strand:+ start:2612 stop:3001 length:390 start_codon:yes stop_codon:yes gene_type:complete
MTSNIPASDVKKACHKMLSKDLFIIFTKPKKPLNEILAYLEEHLSYQIALEEEGILFAAGPFWSEDSLSWNGEGMIIIRASDFDHAVEVASNDPMHKSEARSFEVRPWMLCEGSMTIELNHSKKTYKIK